MSVATDAASPTVALTVVLMIAPATTSAMTSRTRSSPGRNPSLCNRYHPTKASAVLPVAIASAAPAGIGVVTLARSAPRATAGRTSGPIRRMAASEIPVGAHTGVALPWATDKETPTLADTT